MGRIQIKVGSVNDNKFVIREGDVAETAALTIARLIKDVEGTNADPNEYKVLVAYQLLQPDLDLEKLFNIEDDAQGTDSKTVALDALGIKSGHYLIFIKPSTAATKLTLEVNGDIHEVTGQDYKVGRKDKATNVSPDLDLTPYLGKNELKVSRSLIKFKEIGGKWQVFLETKARTDVFVDGERLRYDEGKSIGDTINIGTSPNEPYLRIKTTVRSK